MHKEEIEDDMQKGVEGVSMEQIPVGLQKVIRRYADPLRGNTSIKLS